MTISAKIKWKTQNKIDLQTKDNVHALRKIIQICNKIVYLGFDVTWLLLQAQSELEIKYLLKKQSTKQNVFDRFEQINYSSIKDINNFDIKIVKILKEIKKLDIIMEEIVAIKLINVLSSLFKIYFTILS